MDPPSPPADSQVGGTAPRGNNGRELGTSCAFTPTRRGAEPGPGLRLDRW